MKDVHLSICGVTSPLLLGAADRVIGQTRRFAACFSDARNPAPRRSVVLITGSSRSNRRFGQLERGLDQMGAEHRADFRWLVGIMLAGFGTLIGMMAGRLGVIAYGFHWL